MPIVWFSEENKNLVATIAENNITLNKPVCNVLGNTHKVMLGVNKEEKKVYIKPINKDQCLRGDIPQTQLYNITIRTSYARISNKDFINVIKGIVLVDSFEATKKYTCTWNNHDEVLTISLEGELL